MKIVAAFSGGLDSTTLLYHLLAEGHEVKALSADYGQRHQARESRAAEAIAGLLGIERRVVDLTALVTFFGRNSLSDAGVAVPEGPYSEEGMKLTTVPNRNMILLSVGLAWAASLKFDGVAFGAHGGEYTPYPDCQPAFADAMDRAAAVCDWEPLRVLAPFATWSKGQIVKRGAELGVPFHLTWSCYEGGENPCGKCGTCLDRQKAFAEAGIAGE
ncbi:7-cyano-7-deazaguanine synthase QueC [Zavarzinella formosa]|uniref:7-cyano-7-deazaguanine synthase QueC n=1 Tax=Zavarzinella formosa TaxID=360055 RepID=UPI0002D28A2A|nr:7-cyano-7-deazaguanine synthase QueC [Zavarzinella formosa]